MQIQNEITSEHTFLSLAQSEEKLKNIISYEGEFRAVELQKVPFDLIAAFWKNGVEK